MYSRPIADRLRVSLSLAAEAGDLLQSRFGAVQQLALKGRVDLVTEVDHAAERLIVSKLRAAFPNDTIVAEEGGGSGGDSAWCWYVDPLDGTTNFVEGVPHFCVSIAAYRHGVPMIASVLAPIVAKHYHAIAGGGAFCGGQPIHVSDCRVLSDGLVATGFPYDRQATAATVANELTNVLGGCRGVRRFGSAALDLAAVAEGVFDGYWERRLAPWDIAAGMLLVTEAGGTIGGLGGAPPLTSGDIIATNGALHAPLSALVCPA